MPREVQHAGAFVVTTTAGDGASGGVKGKGLPSHPGLEGHTLRRVAETWFRPGGGVEVEVPNQEGGDGGVEVESKERGHARLVVNIVVKGYGVQEGGPVMHINDKEGGVATQVVSDRQPP